MTIEEMKEKKRELGYTNEQLAAASGVPIGTVQKIFSGETRSPRYQTIRKLEKVLHAAPGNNAYKYSAEGVMMTAEPHSMHGDYYSYRKQLEKTSKKIHNSDYAPVPVSNRIGIAAGKFKVPDDDFFYNDEITEMFEGL